MATYFSDHYAEDFSTNSTVDKQYKISAGIGHARLRYKKALCTVMALTTDQIRFMTFKSSDRIVSILVSATGGSTAGALDVGLHLTGNNHDGAVIDKDLFGAALDTKGALARTESFIEAGTLTEADRAKPLWVVAAIGAASYTVDPGVQFDLSGVPSTSFTDAVEVMTVEVWYTAGD